MRYKRDWKNVPGSCVFIIPKIRMVEGEQREKGKGTGTRGFK